MTNHQKTKGKALIKQLLEYDEDDLRSMPWIIDKISMLAYRYSAARCRSNESCKRDCFYCASFNLLQMESKVFKCSDCGREFELDYQLEMHNKYFHNINSPFKCEKCGQEFGLKEQIDIHISNYKHDKDDKATNDYRGKRPSEPSRKLY